MQAQNELKWLFLDLNSYFASVEQQENPALRGKPVAVVPMDTPHTCAIAASYEAKAYGVKTGTIIRDALRMCPNLICVQARHDKYVEYHSRIIEEVVKHTPIHQICSIDELDSRLPPSKRNEAAAREIAMRIKRGIWANIGEAISCSIGIAPNSLLAKIATDMEKPDGFVVLKPEELPGRLLDLKLTDLPGIGANMERRLMRAGITTVEQFWNISPKHARKIWGNVQGERFWYWLHGYDFPRLETQKSMIGHSRVLDPNLRSPDKARLMARRLLSKAVQRLRGQGLYAGTLSLGVTVQGRSYEDKIRWRRDLRFHPANEPFTFLRHLDTLWNEMRADFHHAYGMAEPRFKKVSTLLLELREKEDITGDLFDMHTPAQQEKSEKQQALAGALDKLQAKYKKEMVTLGVPPKTLAGYVGTKIAFNRVPDEKEFWT
ncbi:MAG: Y-family DNA polymerase [Alphaproteobacteria bacterium]